MTQLLQHLYVAVTSSGVILGLFFGFSLFRHRLNTQGINYLLAALFFVCACSISANAGLNWFLQEHYPPIQSFPEPFILLIGPLCYRYIKLISGISAGAWTYGVHLIPFILASFYSVYFVTLDEGTYADSDPERLLHMIAGIAVYLQLWVYYFLNRHLLSAYVKQLKQSCSSLEQITQDWISYVLAALLFSYTILGFVYGLGHSDSHLPANQILAVILTCVVYMLASRLLRQPEILLHPDRINEVEKAALKGKKYQKSGLTADETEQEFKRVERLMLEEKPHLDPDLSLQQLATKLNLSAHHMSQVINRGSSSNFYDYINRYRVAEVKQLILDPSKHQRPVLALAFAAGFNSKATFNRFFKKETSQTPSQFRKASSN